MAQTAQTLDPTTLSSRGQVVLPRAVREHLKLGEGQKLAIELGDGYVTLRPIRRAGAAPVARGDWRTLEGCLRGTDALGALMKDRRTEVQGGR
jgi:AbrB family looped-hinge helix DNA binding protein